jgi:hypothetical protein
MVYIQDMKVSNPNVSEHCGGAAGVHQAYELVYCSELNIRSYKT